MNKTANINPTVLRTEYLENPIGLDEPAPRFGWTVESNINDQYQTAYQILVSCDEALLDLNKPDMWDSGRIESNDSVSIIEKLPQKTFCSICQLI